MDFTFGIYVEPEAFKDLVWVAIIVCSALSLKYIVKGEIARRAK